MGVVELFSGDLLKITLILIAVILPVHFGFVFVVMVTHCCPGNTLLFCFCYSSAVPHVVV